MKWPWTRKKEERKLVVERRVPTTAKEMSEIADEMCVKITDMFYNDLLIEITKQSLLGNKAFSVPATFFDKVSLGPFYKKDENQTEFGWLGRFDGRPGVDFKRLTAMLKEKGFTATCNSFGQITSIFWATKRYEN